MLSFELSCVMNVLDGFMVVEGFYDSNGNSIKHCDEKLDKIGDFVIVNKKYSFLINEDGYIHKVMNNGYVVSSICTVREGRRMAAHVYRINNIYDFESVTNDELRVLKRIYVDCGYDNTCIKIIEEMRRRGMSC